MSKQKADPNLSTDEARITAELAALDLDDQDMARFTEALGVVLEHFEVISNVGLPDDQAGSPVENHVSLDALREDEPSKGDPEHVCKAAPDFEEGCFIVPRIN